MNLVTKREIDKLGIKTSLLGFGCMRFPTLPDGKIDEARTEKMVENAMARGVNYYDTAFPYHNGESEKVIGRILDKYPRDSYYLATKLPCWEVKSAEDVNRLFNLQLEKLHKDYVDFYLLHALDRNRFKQMKELGVLEKCFELKKQGKIKNFGFSFHDGYDAFEEIVNDHDWDFCQIQFNYMDTDEQAGLKGYELTEKKNIPLIIMEPVKGGSLANLPQEVTEGFRAARPNASAASWALRFVATFPNVKVVLSGMSSEEQVEDNLNTFTDFEPLSEKEKELVKATADLIRSRVHNGCTGCRYCMPCPMGVDIPRCFSVWNEFGMYRDVNGTKWKWGTISEEHRPTNCIQCGACESACPQKLSIRENLATLNEELNRL